MGRFCPILRSKVTYLVCQECEEKECEEKTNSSKKKEKGGKKNEKE